VREVSETVYVSHILNLQKYHLALACPLMERRVRTANKKRESRHILGGWGGNMNPRDVNFQGVFRGRGANEGRG
jgi:hypothetical protein